MNKLQCNHTVEFYLAVKWTTDRWTAWMIALGILWRKDVHVKYFEKINSVIMFIWNSVTEKTKEKIRTVALGGEGIIIVKRNKDFFWGDGNVLYHYEFKLHSCIHSSEFFDWNFNAF